MLKIYVTTEIESFFETGKFDLTLQKKI